MHELYLDVCAVECFSMSAWHGVIFPDELDQQRSMNHKLQEDMDQCIGELQNL